MYTALAHQSYSFIPCGPVQVHLRSAHRCWSRCQCDKHSYTYNSSFKDPDNSSRGGMDKGFLGTGGVLSPGRRRRSRWSGAIYHSENSDGFFKGDHYCRLRVGQKGSLASPDQVDLVRELCSFGGMFYILGKRVVVSPALCSLDRLINIR